MKNHRIQTQFGSNFVMTLWTGERRIWFFTLNIHEKVWLSLNRGLYFPLKTSQVSPCHCIWRQLIPTLRSFAFQSSNIWFSWIMSCNVDELCSSNVQYSTSLAIVMQIWDSALSASSEEMICIICKVDVGKIINKVDLVMTNWMWTK